MFGSDSVQGHRISIERKRELSRISVERSNENILEDCVSSKQLGQLRA